MEQLNAGSSDRGPVLSLAEARQHFPSLRRTWEGEAVAFFDGPGGSQVPQQVIDAVSDYYRHSNSNTHGCFPTSSETDEMLEAAREAVGAFLNAPSSRQISFGANMTTLNFALSHAIEKSLQPGDEVLITQLDHEANRGPWLRLRRAGIVVREVEMQLDGTLDYSDLERKLGERTRLVAVGHASNALGTVNDLGRIRQMTRRLGSWLLVDAVHSAPHFSIDVQEIDPDFLLCSAYKFYGPHIGVLYARANLLDQLDTDRLRTQDASSPYRIETGTLNHAAIAGVQAAVVFLSLLGKGPTQRERLVSALRTIAAHERGLAEQFWAELSRNPAVTLYGPSFPAEERAPTVSFRVAGLLPSQVATRLAKGGLFVWDGDFYAVRAVERLGLSAQGGLVRVGMSLYSTRGEVDRLIGAILSIGSQA